MDINNNIIKLDYLNDETIKKFNKDYINEDLYDVDKFHIIKELGYPKIGFEIEKILLRKELYQLYMNNKREYYYFNDPEIYWIILDINGQCIGILYLQMKLNREHYNSGVSELSGVIETIIKEDNNLIENTNLKTRFIKHFFQEKKDEELNDYLEEWNDFNHFWSIGTYDINIARKIAERLKCKIY